MFSCSNNQLTLAKHNVIDLLSFNITVAEKYFGTNAGLQALFQSTNTSDELTLLEPTDPCRLPFKVSYEENLWMSKFREKQSP